MIPSHDFFFLQLHETEQIYLKYQLMEFLSISSPFPSLTSIPIQAITDTVPSGT